jgi:nicotinate-nucleotide adenylyltransferase
MKNIGLYFGSFNPIHLGHLIIADYFANTKELDEVWLVVSPHNPLKENQSLADERHRFEMVKRAIEGNQKLNACAIEFDLPRPSYTIDTMHALVRQWPNFQFTILMGEDALQSLHLWKQYKELLSEFAIQVFPRQMQEEKKEAPVLKEKYKDIRFVEAPLMGISSTAIREKIKAGASVRYLIVDQVVNYITDHKLYLS